MNDRLEDDFIADFVAEGLEHLEAVEPDLLALEKKGADVSPEIINRVFRAVHSIKGGAGFLNLGPLTRLSHIMETLLMKFRDGEMAPDPDNIDALLSGVDKVRLMMEDIHASDEVAHDNVLAKLNAALEGEAPPVPANSGRSDGALAADMGGDSSVNSEGLPASGQKLERSCTPPDPGLQWVIVKGPRPEESAAAEMDGEILAEAHLEKINLFLIWVRPEEDLEHKGRTLDEFVAFAASIGHCFRAQAQSRRPGENDSAAIILATIIEDDLIDSVLEIPGDRIQMLAPDGLEYGPRPLADDPHPVPLAEKLRPGAATGGDSQATEVSSPAGEGKPRKSLPDPPAREKPAETIRVSVQLIDRLMNQASELVLGRNQLRRELEALVLRNPKLGTVMQNVDLVTSEIQEDIMQMRMQSLSSLFNKFPRMVRDLARHLDKDAELVIEGKEVELDKSIIEGLSDPLTHLIRNCMDHGMEEPAERERQQKPRKGKILLKAFHEGGQVNILVVDDGKGIDPSRLVAKAQAKGILAPERAAKLSEKEKINLIFMPGFSTADKITDISGRGVGMDVVKTNIERLGGHLELDSELGRGTQIRIRLPLTLAIIPSLIVGVSGRRFAIPQVNVQELVLIRPGDVSRRIEKIGEAEVLRLRERLLPLVRLADVLGLERTFAHPGTGEEMADRRMPLADRRRDPAAFPPDSFPTQEEPEEERRRVEADRRRSVQSDIHVVVLRLGANGFGLTVDDLYDTEEIVVKPLSNHIKNAKCFAGATIMGDGRVAMILDTAGIADFARLRFTELHNEELRRYSAGSQQKAGGDRRSLLVFNYAAHEYFALPLESISRLERLEASALHRMGEQEYFDYRGEGLPLLLLERFLPVCPLARDADEYFIIIPKTQGNKAGILVSRILDTLETKAEIKKDATTPRGFSGSAFIDGKLTYFLNAGELLNMFEDACACTAEAGRKCAP